MLLETPLLKIPITTKNPADWLGIHAGLRDSDQILSLSPGDHEQPFCPSGCNIHSWDYLGQSTVLNFPSAYFDVVYLSKLLELHDHDGKQALLQEAVRVVKPGGKVMALSVTCDDQKELFDFATKQGFCTQAFERNRLTNRDIVQLKPSEAAFFKSVVHLGDRKRLLGYCLDNGFPQAKLESMWGIRGAYPISRLFVTLKWIRAI